MVKAPKRPGKQLSAPRSVESLIHVIRGQKVMLDRDLAELYGVPTKRLNEAVRRNPARFPAKFMFRLGVVMLSAVLNSPRAIAMSILVVDAFVRMRELIASNKDIAVRLEKLERGHDRSASVIEILVEDIDRIAREMKEMKALPPVTKRKIGFRLGDEV